MSSHNIDPSGPDDAQAWLRLAAELERQDDPAAALDACRHAIVLWPDIRPALAMQWRLAQRQDDPEIRTAALRALLLVDPDDPPLNSELGATLSARGEFAAAVPFLRRAVPVMQHENATLWNYTTALAVTGAYDELLASQPLLDRLSTSASGAYPPFAHLAVTRLSRSHDRGAIVAAAAAREASPSWLRTETVLGRIGRAIAMREAFSLIRLDYSLARFCCFISRHAHHVLRPCELSAVVNSVWEGWFGAPAETLGVLILSGFERLFSEGLNTADVVGLPTAAEFEAEHYHFGFLAEMLGLLPRSGGQAYASPHIASLMHESVPFLRPMLSGLPFLGIVGPYPVLAERLGKFCGIEDAVAIVVPNDSSRPPAPGDATMDGYLPVHHQEIMDTLSVPFPGAVFLVTAPGPLAIIYCGRIKALGGIAIDIGTLADGWAGR